MPASLYESYHHHNTHDSMERIATELEDNRAVKLAYELAMLGLGGDPSLDHGTGTSTTLAHLEELKNRKSQNMTECVPVPSSEHVAEIVGRQGCKIKALRAKTNTYIKTPVRGEEPVFVVTGRKEDVGLAKREILSAAEHFSQIRASRKNNINSTLAFGQLVANTPGQTTIQVRVPYRVVGLVVGPKGATIKRIQQQTHTYIVTPSRDKEPVFEVTGLPENVETARKEIEAHIALRTGSAGGGGLFDSMDSLEDTAGVGGGGYGSSSVFSSGNSTGPGLGSLLADSVVSTVGNTANHHHHHHNMLITQYSSNSILNGLNSSGTPSNSSSASSSGAANMIANHLEDLHLHSLIESNNFDSKFNLLNGGGNSNNSREGTSSNGSTSIGSTLWGCGESHDSGLGHSPPAFESAGSLSGLANGAIWNELGKVLGSLSPSPTDHHHQQHSAAIGVKAGGVASSHLAPTSAAATTHRSLSIDLGIPLSGAGVNGGGSLAHHHLHSFGISNSNSDNAGGGGGTIIDSNGVDSGTASSLPFTLNGLTSTLATLSASLSTLNECGMENGGGGSELLASLTRQRANNSSPLQYHHPSHISSSTNSIHNNPADTASSSSSGAFCSDAGSNSNSRPISLSVGLSARDYLTYPHH